MKQLLTLFNLSELERRCDIPATTLSIWLKGKRGLPELHQQALERFLGELQWKEVIHDSLIKQFELCRQAKISRNRFQRGKEDEKASKFLRKKLARFAVT